jgi:hypothetical protein
MKDINHCRIYEVIMQEVLQKTRKSAYKKLCFQKNQVFLLALQKNIAFYLITFSNN